jgi:hypothetical protein
MNSDYFYWFFDTLRALPLALWIFVGLGVPYALLLLPRRDWRHRMMVLALGFLCGASLLTMWMFILGTLADSQNQPLLRFDVIFFGTIVLAIVGVVGVIIKMRRTKAIVQAPVRLTTFEKWLIVGMVAIMLTVFITTAFWTFTAYDTWWVYGFQGRLYMLTQRISQDIGYYPPFMSLQYAFYQLAFGQINDHFARVVVPFMFVGSVFSAYNLGARVFENRRIGLLTATIWAFYPHVGEWAQMGDLEIPLTYAFTLSATFFLMAWHEPRPYYRRNYALIAGLVFGVAMWTKPTGGAFVWGVGLMVIAEMIRARGKIKLWWARFEVAVLTGIACVPLGAVWYIRNIAYGHAPVDFPHSSWLSLARRSGDLFGWLLLALGLLLIFLITQRREKISAQFMALVGVGGGFILVGVMPSMPWLNPDRLNAPASYLSFVEWDFVLIGGALVLWALWQYKRRYATGDIWTASGKIFHALLLATPYFITWFYAYSYHYRLSFAIVPLLILPNAVILAQFPPLLIHPVTRRLGYALGSILLFIIVLNPIFSATANRDVDYLWDGTYPDDKSKYMTVNGPLVLLADKLIDYRNRTGKEPIVLAPGEQQLPFFFPLMSITSNTLPMRLSELDGASHFLYGTLAGWRYRDEQIGVVNNQVVGSLARRDIMTQMFFNSDATFQYELYELTHKNRFQVQPLGVMYDQSVMFGDFAQLLGEDMSNSEFWGNNIYINLLWQVNQQPAQDYMPFLELVDAQTQVVVYRWEKPIAQSEHCYYSTLAWETGEIILDEDKIFIDPAHRAEVPSGRDYRLRLGMYRADDPAKTPITVMIDGIAHEYFVFRAIFRHG